MHNFLICLFNPKMTEIEKLIQKLHKQKLEDNSQDYTTMVELSDEYKNKSMIFKLLIQNSSDHAILFPLIWQLVSKLKNDYDDILVKKVLEYFKNIKSSQEYDWIGKIIFLLLEFTKDKKKNNEIKLLILENIKNCAQHINIINYLYNFMLNEGSSDIVYAILVYIPEISDDFVRVAIQQTNIQILKNTALVLTNLCQTQKKLFVNYKHFDVFLDSEHYFLRNCYLEILYSLVEVFKELEDLESINIILYVLKERLNDIYFNVRYRSLTLIGQLFENNCVPINMRNQLIKAIGDKILDKTVLVRKKAGVICNNLLINNPFITEENLQKKESVDPEKIKYYDDLSEFHDIIKSILKNVMSILNSIQGGDNQTYLDFIKLCLYYEIENSKECFEQTFDLIWESDSILICLKDIISKLKSKRISVVSFLKKFVGSKRNKSFEKIIRELYKRGIINIYDELCNDILKNKDIFETSYLLYCIGRYLENSKFYTLLRHVSEILFSVDECQDLNYALDIYCNILKLNIKNKENEDSEILKLIIKNLIKMTFLDFRVIQDTINLIYKISKDSEIFIRRLLEGMNNKNINLLKMVYSIGCIGISHMKYLDVLERLSKNKKEKINVVVPEEIKERRKSINASRMSIQSFIEEDEERVKKLYTDNTNIINNKTDEEVSDFFFYLKEKDLLYNKDGLLYEFSKMIPEFCLSDDQDLQEVSHLSLFNLMCISSEYFLEYKDIFYKAFNHSNNKIRANAVISMGDFLLCYNYLVEGNTKLLFDRLEDTDLLVRKNALLIIYNLLKRNILRLGSNSIFLTNLIFDKNEEIRDISRNIIYTLSDNDNFITTIVYEKISSKYVDNITEYIDFFVPLLKDKSKETVFLKLLRTTCDKDIMTYMYNKFGFSEKFIEDIKHIEEFKGLIIESK